MVGGARTRLERSGDGFGRLVGAPGQRPRECLRSGRTRERRRLARAKNASALLAPRSASALLARTAVTRDGPADNRAGTRRERERPGGGCPQALGQPRNIRVVNRHGAVVHTTHSPGYQDVSFGEEGGRSWSPLTAMDEDSAATTRTGVVRALCHDRRARARHRSRQTPRSSRTAAPGALASPLLSTAPARAWRRRVLSRSCTSKQTGLDPRGSAKRTATEPCGSKQTGLDPRASTWTGAGP